MTTPTKAAGVGKIQAEALADALIEGCFAPNILQNEDGLRRNCAAELRRLSAVEAELESTKKALALVQQHHATAWNRGHEAGMRASRDAVRRATDAVQRDAWGNTQLTEALLAAEAERDRLAAEVEALRESMQIAVSDLTIIKGHIGRYDAPGYTNPIAAGVRDCIAVLQARIDAARKEQG